MSANVKIKMNVPHPCGPHNRAGSKKKRAKICEIMKWSCLINIMGSPCVGPKLGKLWKFVRARYHLQYLANIKL